MLYDDLDPQEKPSGSAAKPAMPSWASGMKMFQSHLHLKKAGTTQPKREALRKQVIIKKENEASPSTPSFTKFASSSPVVKQEPRFVPNATKPPFCSSSEYEWNIEGEYDPTTPNDYEKIMKERRDKRNDFDRSERKSRGKDIKESKSTNREQGRERNSSSSSGFSKRPVSDDEEEMSVKRPGMGAAIAPPPSLQESGSSGGKSVAAKIMAKYGFREGQGLGKLQQGISTALVVEKTSKRGGRIIAEQEAKELAMLPPLFPPPVPAVGTPPANTKNEPQSITDLMKNPSKVVLLRNMVGPGEVDDDLEPEVKEECQTKYGDVVQVVLYEMPGVPDDEAVRIFVEFKRVESAIKAVVDINGRFFGGRQVKAGFYDLEKLKKLDLAS